MSHKKTRIRETKDEQKLQDVEKQTLPDLIQLAKDIRAGQVFTDRHFSEGNLQNLIEMVFMPLIFGALEGLNPESIGILYEYYREARTGRCINGYPIFMSVRILHKDDWEKVCELMQKLEDMEKAVVGMEMLRATK